MKKITDRLFEMRDTAYRDFHARLIPAIDKECIIGVRMPQLRAYAREIAASGDRDAFMSELPHRYYEENNLHAWLAGTISRDIDEVLARIDEFLPYVDNWATCDMFPPKIFAKYPERVECKIREWIASEHTYTVRFAIVTLLGFYLDDRFRREHLDLVASVRRDEYYIYMAAAWYLSFALIKQYEAALPLLESRTLDRRVQNMAIRKAVESYRIDDVRKTYLKTLKM